MGNRFRKPSCSAVNLDRYFANACCAPGSQPASQLAHLTENPLGDASKRGHMAHLAHSPSGAHLPPTWRKGCLTATRQRAHLAATCHRANLAHLAGSPPSSGRKTRVCSLEGRQILCMRGGCWLGGKTESARWQDCQVGTVAFDIWRPVIGYLTGWPTQAGSHRMARQLHS